jgi:hypothetical protein
LPTGRVVLAPDADPAGPAFFEWELRGQTWSNEHPHDEYVFVLEGSLRISAGNNQVTSAGKWRADGGNTEQLRTTSGNVWRRG